MHTLEFYDEEKLYRAIEPKIDFFIKADGSITSGAFKSMHNDKLSVDRQMKRSNEESVRFIKQNHNYGIIVSVTVGNCIEKEIMVEYDPVIGNEFHSVIFKDQERCTLSKSQAKHLSRCCVIEDDKI